MMFYCCAETLKVFEVNVLPADPTDSPNRIRIHDADRDRRAWYTVDIRRVQQTQAQAIWAARLALNDKDNEIYREMRERQAQRDEINRLLECGDPENGGT